VVAPQTKGFSETLRIFMRDQPELPIWRALALPECSQEVFGNNFLHVGLPPGGIVAVREAGDILHPERAGVLLPPASTLGVEVVVLRAENLFDRLPLVCDLSSAAGVNTL